MLRDSCEASAALVHHSVEDAIALQLVDWRCLPHRRPSRVLDGNKDAELEAQKEDLVHEVEGSLHGLASPSEKFLLLSPSAACQVLRGSPQSARRSHPNVRRHDVLEEKLEGALGFIAFQVPLWQPGS